MIEASTTNLKQILQDTPKEEVIKALQINLGYEPKVHIPTIMEFLSDPYYLGNMTDNGNGIYPYWKKALQDIFPDPLYIKYDTVLLRSAIGTGKSSIARFIVCYIMCKMILMNNPHKFFGLLPNKDLVVFLYALTNSTIDNAMYNPLAELFEGSPFFRGNIIGYKGGYYRFTNNISVLTGSSISKNVGLDIFLAWLDEIQAEKSGSYSYNYENYNSLKARIESRFMLKGRTFFNSLLLLSGSPGGNESFAEKLTELKKTKKDEKIIIYNTPLWEVKGNYSGEKFKVFIGDDANEPKIITDSEIEPYKSILGDTFDEKVIDVPIELKPNFEDDILIAIRDMAGKVTRSSLSYITNVEKLRHAFSLPKIVFNSDVIKIPFFDNTQIQDYIIPDPEMKLLVDRLRNKNKPRYIHIDLGLVNDLTGFSMSYIEDYVKVESTDAYGKKVKTYDPWYINDFTVGFSRPNNESTSISKIRTFILYLREQGINIKMVSFDGYQSAEIMQDLTLAGIPNEKLSIIRTSDPFDIVRNAIYQGRLSIPRNEVLYQEFLRFKKEITNNGYKVYYDSTTSASGSHGDLTEALVGSIYDAYLDSKSQMDPLESFNDDIQLPNVVNSVNKTLFDSEDIEDISDSDFELLLHM